MHSIILLFRRIIKFFLARPVTWLADRFSSSPKRENVMASLSKLYEESVDQPGKKSGSKFSFDPHNRSIIIFSDQHKGARNGADDFAMAADNYKAALDYYHQNIVLPQFFTIAKIFIDDRRNIDNHAGIFAVLQESWLNFCLHISDSLQT